MNLQHALECITNSEVINKLDANIQLNDNITSSDIKWSKFGKLDITGGWNVNGDKLYIDSLVNFNGELILGDVKINDISRPIKSLNITRGSTKSEVSFGKGASVNNMTFNTILLESEKGIIPEIENAIISDNFVNEDIMPVNLEGFLSNAKNISRDAVATIDNNHFRPLGYFTVDNNRNENWANVTIENPSFDIKPHNYIIPTSFYNNLIFYVADDFIDYNSNCFTLDYVNGFIDDIDGTNIVIPQAGALKAYLPDEVPELPVILGDYCFSGIGSKKESEKDRHLYLTFDDNFIFNTDLDSSPRDDGATVEIKESSRPFTENTFIARPGAIQKIHINLPEVRPGVLSTDTSAPNEDITELYFSDFFTTLEKTTNTDGTEGPTYSFILDENTFNSYKDLLSVMVGGSENVVFNSPYQEIEAIIEVD